MDEQAAHGRSPAGNDDGAGASEEYFGMYRAKSPFSSCRGTVADSIDLDWEFGVSREPLIFNDNGPILADDQSMSPANNTSQLTERDIVSTAASMKFNASGPGPTSQRQLTGLENSNDGPSINQLARRRHLEETKQEVIDWLSRGNTDFSVPADDVSADSIRQAESWEGTDDGIPLGHKTNNRQKLGRVYFTGREGQMSKTDLEILASNRNWADAPMDIFIKRDRPSVPETSAEAMRQYQKMCRGVEEGAQSPKRDWRLPWLPTFDRATEREIEKALVTERYQPQSSQAAIDLYSSMNDENRSMVSGAATWGTERPEIPGMLDQNVTAEVSGNRLTVFREWGSPFLPELRNLVSRSKAGENRDTEREESRRRMSKVSERLMQKRSRFGVDTCIDIMTPNQDSIARSSFSPGQTNNEEKREEVSEHESGLFDKMTPNHDGFLKHIMALYPAMAQNNKFLLDRLVGHQIVRYQMLMDNKIRHMMLGENCPSGRLCVALGGRARLQHDSTWNLDPECFPNIPKPPTAHLPAELECQVCYESKHIRRPSDWTKHICEDVMPYTCTWEDCRDSKPFKSKTDWICHENENHRHPEWWICDIDDCSHIDYRQDNFVQHLVLEHSFPEPKPNTYKRGTKRRDQSALTWEKVHSCHSNIAILSEAEPCKFCGRSISTWKQLSRHMSKHMEQISHVIFRLVERDSKEIESRYIGAAGSNPPSQGFGSAGEPKSPSNYALEASEPSQNALPSQIDSSWGDLTGTNFPEPYGLEAPHLSSRSMLHESASHVYQSTVASAIFQTDSGYASLRNAMKDGWPEQVDLEAAHMEQGALATQVDDAATEYTDAASVATVRRESYISDFAEDLFRKIHDLEPDKDDIEKIAALLPELLKTFALKLGSQAPTDMHRNVMYFVHRYRSFIADAFKDRGLQEEKHADETFSSASEHMPLKDLMASKLSLREEVDSFTEDQQIPLSDLMTSWFEGHDLEQMQLQDAQEHNNMDLHELGSAVNDDNDDTESKNSSELDRGEEDNNASVTGYRDLVLETDAFKWLLERLRLELRLTPTEPKAMEAIRGKIVRTLRTRGKFSRKSPPEEFKATFKFRWDLKGFFKQQEYNAKPSEALPKIITLTGSGQDAQALSCAGYLAQTWPLTGAQILTLMQDVLDSDDDVAKSCILSDGSSLTARFQGPDFSSEAYGNASSLAEIGEQLAWLTTALRPSPLEDGLTCCYPFVSEVRSVTLSSKETDPALVAAREYQFGFRVESAKQLSTGSSGQCWYNMFKNPVVVIGYPIPSRAEFGTGMEAPLNMMAGLGRSEQVDCFGGMTFIKGFSTILIPMKRIKDTILWHFVYNRDGSRISYLQKILSHVGVIKDLELHESRHIVGWCTDAEYYAGSAEANHSVGSSGLTKPPESGALAGLVVSPGRSIIGGAPFILGLKDTPAHVTRNGYIPKLQWISSKFILLWDEDDKRGWLINGTSALLYVVRVSLAHNSTDKFKAAFLLKKGDLKESKAPLTAESAIDVLIDSDNLALKLYKEKDGYLLLQGRIEHYCNILEKLIDHQADIAGEDGSKLADHPRRYLEGWDFRDLATSRDPLYPRVASLPAEGKGWVDLMRAVHAVTLFGRGFGELFKPVDAGICDLWAGMPKGKYYVAAGLCDLIQVANNNNPHGDKHVRLSEKIIWHTPTSLFGSCQCRGALRSDHCEPVQTLLPSTMLSFLLPRRVTIPQECAGAVIFGQHSSFPWMWKDHGPPEETCVMQSPRTSDIGSFHDSGMGLSAISNGSSSAVMPRSETPRLNRLASGVDTDTGSSNATVGANETYVQEDYTVGILCALSKELLAVRALFDKKHGSLAHMIGDINHYSLGQIGNHFVAAACLPKGDYGTNPAADTASNMKRTFPNIKFCLMVGIGGGVPSKQNDIRLGDVVVSSPTANYPGVIQYDRGKDNENRGFERTGSLPPPPWFLMTAVSRLESNPDQLANPLQPYLTRIQDRIRYPERLKYQHPGQEYDTFSQTECQMCKTGGTCYERNLFLKSRRRRITYDPEIFYGLIASGNKVIKDAHVRNEWADTCGVLCFEMEAAGIMNTFPCLVIRGICDYADSSKNKMWQEYAAATAAAYAKLLLEESGGYGVPFGRGESFRKRSRSFTEDDMPTKHQRSEKV